MIVERFQYTPIERQTHPSGYRVYVTPTGVHPSVTTILDRTSDKSGLDAWRARVGEEKAAQISKEATDLGSLMHNELENHIHGLPRRQGNNLVVVQARKMADVIIQCGLPKVDEYWGVEVPLYMPDLYAGTTDILGVHEGRPAIMDFKTAKKIKKESQIENYFLQLTAYALAHNEVHGTDIRKGVILMASREFDFKEFVIEGLTFDRYASEWARRVEMFYSNSDSQAA